MAIITNQGLTPSLPKERVICAASFPERVLHHAIMNVCEPVLERYAIHDSYACRTGKGMHIAVHRAQTFCRKFPWYLKLDIRKYFESIDHEAMLRLLERRFKDKELLVLFARLLATYRSVTDGVAAVPPTVGFGGGPGATPAANAETGPRGSGPSQSKGLPIGNLISQHLANFYLGHLDHWIKETLRVPGYVRYMDDFVLWGDDKSVLKAHLAAIRGFLETELRLVLKDNVQLNRCTRGLPFLGYRISPRCIALGPRARCRFAHKLVGYEHEWQRGVWSEADLARHMEALLSYVRFADTLGLRREIISRMSVAA